MSERDDIDAAAKVIAERNGMPLGTAKIMVAAARERRKGMQHKESYSQSEPLLSDPTAGTLDALEWGARYIPAGHIELGAMLAPHTLPGKIYKLATGRDSREELQQYANRVQDYYANPEIADPSTPWQHGMALAGEIIPETIGGGIMKLTQKAGKKLPAAYSRMINAPVDQGRRQALKDTSAVPIVAATTTIGGLPALKALTKGATKEAAPVAATKAAAKVASGNLMGYGAFADKFLDRIIDRAPYLPEPGDFNHRGEAMYDWAEGTVDEMYKFYQLGKMDNAAVRKELLDDDIVKQIDDIYFDNRNAAFMADPNSEKNARLFVESLPEDIRANYEAYLTHLDDMTDPPTLYMHRDDPYMENYQMLDRYRELDAEKVDEDFLNLVYENRNPF